METSPIRNQFDKKNVPYVWWLGELNKLSYTMSNVTKQNEEQIDSKTRLVRMKTGNV